MPGRDGKLRPDERDFMSKITGQDALSDWLSETKFGKAAQEFENKSLAAIKQGRERRRAGPVQERERMPDSSGNEALDRANAFAQQMGIEEEPDPETAAGSVSFLEKLFPGLSAKMAGKSDLERRDAARAAVKAQADADPDSILNIFGLDAMKEVFSQIALGQQAPPPSVQGGNPATVGQATAGIVGGTLPEELDQ